jgi:LysR family transcriptional regulator, low CO2-responsive transcriptional regulator
MRYSQLRAFHAVARAGSFSRAASGLGITQPAVTLQVKALEASHGVNLFRRGARRVVLTDVGRSLLQLTGRLFGVEDEIRDYLSAAEGLKSGVVHLAADGPHVALQLIAQFRKRHPNVRVVLSLGNATSVWKALLEAEVDAVVISNPSVENSIRVMPLVRQHMVALMPAQHKWANRATLRLEDIQDQPLVMREQGSNTRRTLERAFRKMGITPVSMLEIGSREAVREAVAMGLGIGFIFEREATDDPRCVAIGIKDLESSSLDMLAFRRSDGERAVIMALSRIAAEFARGRS